MQNKLKNNKIYPKKYQQNKGFAILFAVVISSVILAVTLGVADVSLKEIKFSTEAKDTNDAFFAADTGAECALYYDRTALIDNAFTGTATMTCNGLNITLSGSFPFWSFILSGLGSEGQGCARVTVDKTNLPITTITSKGYNNGGSLCIKKTNTVERELELNYLD